MKDYYHSFNSEVKDYLLQRLKYDCLGYKFNIIYEDLDLPLDSHCYNQRIDLYERNALNY